jgi:hypothetical protein
LELAKSWAIEFQTWDILFSKLESKEVEAILKAKLDRAE